jgi:glycosyltransferase involved in cell wall biosynthesis
MKIGLVTRKSEAKWGGDLTALYTFYEGLKELGQEVIIGKTAEEVLAADFIFLSNTSLNLNPDFNIVTTHGKRYGIVCFHSDRTRYYSPCHAFANFVGLCLHQKEIPFYSIEQLVENPNIIDPFSFTPSPFFAENLPVLEKAEVCIATSPTEAATLQRDSAACQAKVVYLECGIADSYVTHKTDAFLKWTGLNAGEYVVQVGRMELRKNQLASILAMRNLDMPLVFIATESFYPDYEQMCLNAIRKWRKAPTLLISQHLKNSQEGNLRILQMPEGKKLSQEMLVSAYQNAGLHLHPAFCELPGLTYLEAAKLGVPTVASSWTTVYDYFIDPASGQYLLDDRIVYTPPYHLGTITQLITTQFGKKFDKTLDYPIFCRTRADVARDLLSWIN